MKLNQNHGLTDIIARCVRFYPEVGNKCEHDKYTLERSLR